MNKKNETTIEKIENGRAAFAFREVKEYIEKNGQSSKFRSYIKKMPAMIQVNGLGQTLAFYYSNHSKEKEYGDIYNIIGKWCSIQLSGLINSEDEFVEQVINLNSKSYKVVTVETLSLLNWMRRFADGMIRTQD
ncbi:type III-B CRISPR module-associated protein Cmr5 [Bacillus sp. HMF5848]|uniref:type III-B CRISPR module-associated protein Cmr5 n=1 Tax=Bacillus sp. HMF5848 TaxID=2495421 RepID=UPI000F7736F6|nr:type III-B CRISPR module-associated protein Cmr5 [Bacillus sp. HMF5848]RSK26558.1 type III-B CRISPR module-associated protein Cmr5 [Bacillus sp. HMF5848]